MKLTGKDTHRSTPIVVLIVKLKFLFKITMVCFVLVKISLCPGILTGTDGHQRYHHIILIVTVEQENAIVDLFKQRHWMYIKAGKASHNASLSSCLSELLIYKREQ